MPVNLKLLRTISYDLKLLYVEDDINARKTTLRLLDNFFNDITVAVDGEDGVEKFKTKEFDLILSDINMPNLNGLEMLNIIRTINKSIPILFLSAYNDSEYFMQAIELDVDGYILKPLAHDQFLKTLFKIVQKINLLALNGNYQTQLEQEVKSRNEEIEHKLHFDSLTNLLSPYSFFMDIDKLNAPVIFLIDINEFKVINEVYGSSIGSKVLQKFAADLSLAVDGEEYKIYRLSADEFAIVGITKYIEPKKYEILIEKLFKELNNLKIKVDANIISVDITIGSSTVEMNGYESAKIALDYAKEHKKPFVIYSSDIDHRKKSSLTLKCRDDISSAIDDFGSGFSNFEYILEIEPDYLKIDGSLVKDIDKDERAHTLVNAIVQFSHKLGIKIIAEYVHSETIFEMLKKLGVDEYQVYMKTFKFKHCSCFTVELRGEIDAQ